MAIILRDDTLNNTGKGSELTYLEMDTNLESYYYSSSYTSGILYLHTTGSDTHSIDLSGFVDDLETGSLVRVSAFNTATGSFVTSASTTLNVITFTKGDGTTFNVTVDTGSGAGGGADVSALNAATGSYLYSGSYIGSNTIRLYSEDTNYDIDLTPLAGGLATDITDLNIFTGSAQTSITALNNATGSYVYSGSFDGVDTVTLYSEDTNYTLDLGALAGGGSGVQPSETGSFYYSSSVNLNTITFFQGDGSSEVVTVDTGSATGGATSPGGSNTHIQFNQLGSFGGESALTYTSASQTLTIDKSTAVTAASPNIKLLGNSSTIGDLSGVIAASATTQNTAPASIKFRNASSHGLGDFSTDVILSTALFDGVSTTSERTALTLSASGDAYFSYDIFAPNLDSTSQPNVVGFNTTTGELTYFSTGSFISETLNTGSLQNPSISRDAVSGVTNVVFDVDIATSDANWTIESVSIGGTPSGAGKARINNSSPASVTQFSVWKTANSSVDMSSPLEQLAPGSIITLTAVGGNTATGTYRITVKSLVANAVTYTVSYIEGAAFTFAVGATFTIDTVEGVFEYDLQPGYNYLNIRNNGSASDRLRLRYEAATGEYPDGGGYIPVQILCHSSGQGYSLDYIADNRTYAWSLTGYTGVWSSTNPVIGFITNDFKPGDRFISSFLVWGEGNNEGIVPQNWTVYQNDTALEPSDRTVPTQYYQNTFNSDERITTTTIPNLYELNGGTINIDPTGGESDKLILGLGGLLTDYSTAVNNVNGANLVILNIVTPTAKNGWSIYWLGYRSSTNERYRIVNTSINGGVGTNSPVKLDWSGRAEISVDFSESKIFVWSSNWEN